MTQTAPWTSAYRGLCGFSESDGELHSAHMHRDFGAFVSTRPDCVYVRNTSAARQHLLEADVDASAIDLQSRTAIYTAPTLASQTWPTVRKAMTTNGFIFNDFDCATAEKPTLDGQCSAAQTLT